MIIAKWDLDIYSALPDDQSVNNLDILNQLKFVFFVFVVWAKKMRTVD